MITRAHRTGRHDGLTYTVTITQATDADIARAARILRAAVLQIEDKAPLFDGPAPANTNTTDAANYREGGQ